jgi:hypothetical protein
MSFESVEQKNHLRDVMDKIENFYTTHVSFEVNENHEEENRQINDSKIFVAYLTASFLNSIQCMKRLKYAIMHAKKVFLLENECSKISSNDVKEFKLNSLNCVTITFKCDESSSLEELFKKIQNHLNQVIF